MIPVTIGMKEENRRAFIERMGNVREGLRQVYMRALNEANYGAKRLIVDDLSATINCDRGQIEARIDVEDARQVGASAQIKIREKPLISVRRLQPHQHKTGASYRPLRYGGRVFVKSGFGPRIPRLGRQIFKREGKKRLPIARVPGVSVAAVARQMDLSKKYESDVRFLFKIAARRLLIRRAFNIQRAA